jgi:hypothetical protein
LADWPSHRITLFADMVLSFSDGIMTNNDRVPNAGEKMLTRWRNKVKRDRFYRLTRGILDTRPMPVVDAPLSIVSMVGNNDVQLYLLAMKSFYSHVGRGKIVAIIAEDMPSQSRALLEHHFPRIKIEMLEGLDTGTCPRGGTWERLVYLLERSQHEYAIQLDCDTLAFGTDVSEVIECIRSNTAFALGSVGHNIVALPEAAARAHKSSDNYVGLAAERLFDRYPDAAHWKYVRASSGFAGFAKGGFHRRNIEDFHRNMEEFMGSRWREWGTEQCGSNFAIANSPNTAVLHRPKYGNFVPSMENDKASFLHFFGTYRYKEDFYATKARDVIATLLK